MDTAPASRVFVSYSQRDRPVVERLVDALSARGLAFNMDTDVRPGQEWDRELARMLDEAAAVLVVWSPASAASTNVVSEAARAQTTGKLIPVSLAGIEVIPPPFRSIYTVDLFGWEGDEGDSRLEAVVRALGDRVEASGSAPSSGATPDVDPAAVSLPESSAQPETALKTARRRRSLSLRPGARELLGLTLEIAEIRGVAPTNLDVVLAAFVRPRLTALDKEELEAAATTSLVRAIPAPAAVRLEAALSAAGVDTERLSLPPSTTRVDPRLANFVEQASELVRSLAGTQVWSHHLVAVALAGPALPADVQSALGLTQAQLRAALLAGIARRWPAEPASIWAGVLGGAEGDQFQLTAPFASDYVAVRRRARAGEEPPPPLVDHLGVDVYVGMLATLIAKKTTKVPVSIGLFGEWGSGKTYFMELVRQQVDALADGAKASKDGPYHDDILQVRFNAWHYADTNLWASLAAEFFDQLDETDTIELRRDELKKRRAEASRVVVDLQASSASALEKTATLRAELSAATAARQERSRKFDVDVIKAVTEDPELRERLAALVKRLGFEDDDKEEVLKLARDLRGIGDDTVAMKRVINRRSLWLPFCLLLVTMGVIGLAVIAPAGWVRWVRGGTVAAITAVIADVGVIVGKARALTRSLVDVADRAEAVESRVVNEDESLRRMADQLRQAEADEALARARVDEVVTLIGQLDRQLAELNPGRRLYQFLAERAASNDYRGQLGVVSLVRRDFEQLVALMDDWRRNPSEKAEFKPIDRIVLYIDDLDRCEPDQVVAVLQAVHLLLAMDLFVVVVGVDPRWLLRSLRRRYRRILGTGQLESAERDLGFAEATPQNYLEKIFQVPFVLPSMDATGFTRLLGHLAQPDTPDTTDTTATAGQGATPPAVRPAGADSTGPVPGGGGGSTPATTAAPVDARSEIAAIVTGSQPREVKPITGEELTLLSLLGPLVPTPRAATRMFNIYGMLRSTGDLSEGARFLGGDGRPGDYEAVAQLLGILTAAPQLFGPLLWGRRDDGKVEARALCRAHPAGDWNTFVDVLEPRALDGAWCNDVADGLAPAEVEAWQNIVRELKVLRKHVQLDDIKPYRRWGPLVGRFSFLLSTYAADEPERVDAVTN